MGNGGSTPSQYGIPAGAKDLQDLIEYRKMDFALGNIFKAAYRIGTKNDDLYEINKILWFADRLKKYYENTMARTEISPDQPMDRWQQERWKENIRQENFRRAKAPTEFTD